MPASSDMMQTCIEECLACHRLCLGMLMTHCLEARGEHLAPDHVRLMTACATMCQAAADVMLTGSKAHLHSCRACAAICEECADSCAGIEGMEGCATQCRRCAAICREMAG